MRRLKLLALATLFGLSQGALGQIYGGGGGGMTVGNAVSGGNAYAVLTEDGSQNLAAGTGLKWSGAAAGTGLQIVAGTATTDVAALSLTRTNNNSAVATGVKWTFTDTTSAAGFLPFQILGGSTGVTNLLSVDKNGAMAVPAGSTSALSLSVRAGEQTGIYSSQVSSLDVAIAGVQGFSFQAGSFILRSASSTIGFGSGFNAGIGWGGTANQLVFGGSYQAVNGGSATSRAEINKSVTAIADNVATDLVTITIPNGAHSAGGKFILKCSAGAGGAIGANEFTAANEYDWIVTRTTGVNAVATLSTAFLTTITASVAGGATPTLAGSISAISGAVGAANTFTFKAVVHAITGSSTNHTCFVYGTLLNDNASGVTIL